MHFSIINGWYNYIMQKYLRVIQKQIGHRKAKFPELPSSRAGFGEPRERLVDGGIVRKRNFGAPAAKTAEGGCVTRKLRVLPILELS